MADSTISQLPQALPLDGTEYIPVDQGGVTKKTRIAQIGNGTVIITPGKTLYVSNTLTLAGTDGVTVIFPSTSATLARTDAGQTFSGTQVFSSTISGGISGNAGTATTLQTARAINGVNFDGSTAITVPVNNADDTTTNAAVYPLWTATSGGNHAAKVSTTRLSFNPSTGILTATGFSGPLTGNVTGNLSGNVTGDVTGNVSGSSGSCTGNAATATALQTPRMIDGTSFNGTANITVVAPAIHAAPSKATPVDADELGIWDSVGLVLNKLTWANLKTTLGGVFAALAGSATQVFSVAAATAAAHATRADQTFLAQDFRLTLTSATPVTTADVTGAATLYCTPYTGNRIALYNGTIWVNYTSAEFSLALGTLTAAKPYDVFCYQNAGTPTLEFLSWTNDTTRATALAFNGGILIKSGDATRRYLGTFYTTSTTATEDSVLNRYVWNYYNRVIRNLFVYDGTATWQYQTATIRQARANAANQVNFMVGVAEDCVSATLQVTVQASNAGSNFQSGIGLDSTTAFAAASQPWASNIATTGGGYPAHSVFNGYVTSGKHSLIWLEYGNVSSGTITWLGTLAPYLSGLNAKISG